MALGNELHPLTLLQALVPDLFGVLDAPVELWWGGRFFRKDFPYFLSIHAGVVALALAAAGWSRLARRDRLALGALALAAVWYALGARGGLAPLLQAVPGLRWFRFPSKALLVPYLTLVPAIALGLDALRSGAGWRDGSALDLVRAPLQRATDPVPGGQRMKAQPVRSRTQRASFWAKRDGVRGKAVRGRHGSGRRGDAGTRRRRDAGMGRDGDAEKHQRLHHR